MARTRVGGHPGGNLGAGAEVKFTKDIADVAFDGPFGDHKRSCNFAIGETFAR